VVVVVVVVVAVVVVVVALVLVLIPLSPNPLRMIDWNMEATSTEGGSLIRVTGEFVCITLRRIGRPVTTRLTERESENILSRAASVVLLMAGLVDLVVDMVVVVVCVFSCIEIRLEMMCPMEEASFWVCCNLSVFKGLSPSLSSSSSSSVGFNTTFIFSSTSSFDGFFFFLFFFCGFWVLIFGDSGGSSVFLLTLTCCTCTECGRPFAGNCIEVARLQTFES